MPVIMESSTTIMIVNALVFLSLPGGDTVSDGRVKFLRKRPSCGRPPWVQGEIEWPKCCKDMGLWTAVAFCEEQQRRLLVDEEGEPLGSGTPTRPMACEGSSSSFGAPKNRSAIMAVDTASLLSKEPLPTRRVLPKSLSPTLVQTCLEHYDNNNNGNFEYGELVSVVQELRNVMPVPFRFQDHLHQTIVVAAGGGKDALTPTQFGQWMTNLLQGGDKDVFQPVE